MTHIEKCLQSLVRVFSFMTVSSINVGYRIGLGRILFSLMRLIESTGFHCHILSALELGRGRTSIRSQLCENLEHVHFHRAFLYIRYQLLFLCYPISYYFFYSSGPMMDCLSQMYREDKYGIVIAYFICSLMSAAKTSNAVAIAHNLYDVALKTMYVLLIFSNNTSQTSKIRSLIHMIFVILLFMHILDSKIGTLIYSIHKDDFSVWFIFRTWMEISVMIMFVVLQWLSRNYDSRLNFISLMSETYLLSLTIGTF